MDQRGTGTAIALVVSFVLVSTGAIVALRPSPRTARRSARRYSAPESDSGGAAAQEGVPVPHATSDDGAFEWRSTAVSNTSDFGEPSVDVDHDNNVYVTAPGGAGVQLWKSRDLGKTFEYTEIAAPNGGGDSEIEFNLKDVGFIADLEVSDSAVSRSTDGFKTWEQQSVGVEQDRQWLAHRCAKTIYLVYHDFAAELELLSRSDDAGKTWAPDPVPVGNPGDAPGEGEQEEPVAADQGVNTFSGPIAVNQKNGDVYVVYAISTTEGNVETGTPPFGEPEQIIVGVSHDEGQTFELHLIRGGEVGSLAGVIFPWITVDAAGNVYVSYAARDDVDDSLDIYMAYSTDRGDTWRPPYRVNTDVGTAHIYSTMSAGDDGVVDVAWYTSNEKEAGSPTGKWYVDFAQVRNAASQHPQVSQSRVYEQSIHNGGICLEGTLCVLGGDRSLLDFFQVQVGKDGMANIAFANNGSPDTVQRVWYARQTGGRSAGNALMDMRFCGKPEKSGGGGGGGELPGPRVRMNVSDRQPRRGDQIVFRTRLERCKGHKGTNMQLRQEQQNGRYTIVATKKLSRRCRARFELRAAFPRATFRAIWPKQDDDHRQGRSKPRTIVTH